jgi:hypothetical protein
MAFTDIVDGLAEVFGEWDARGEQDVYEYQWMLTTKERDHERRQCPLYKARKRVYMREYMRLAYVRDRHRIWKRAYQQKPEVIARRNELYGEKKRQREKRRRQDPVIGERMRRLDRERRAAKAAAAKQAK